MAVSIIEKVMPSKAWCIDRSGKIYDVWVHPFGDIEEDSVEDALWLLCNDFSNVENECIDYVSKQLIYDYLTPDSENYKDELVDAIVDTIQSIECLKTVKSQSHSVTNEIIGNCMHLLDMYGNDMSWIDKSKLDQEGKAIKKYLNDNIMRVRLGSEYQTTSDRSGSLYFRISSSGFDWYDIIMNFVFYKLPTDYKICDITVEKDKSATGIYKLYVDHMPFSDFLMKRSMVIESVKRCCDVK